MKVEVTRGTPALSSIPATPGTIVLSKRRGTPYMVVRLESFSDGEKVALLSLKTGITYIPSSSWIQGDFLSVDFVDNSSYDPLKPGEVVTISQ